MKTLKDIAVLFAITLVAGLCLGLVYNVTQEAREGQQEKTKLAAYQDVMPDMENYEAVDYDSEAVDEYIEKTVVANEEENNISVMNEFKASVDEIVEAFDYSGQVIGYIVTITDSEAYDGTLQMAVGIDTEGTVLGISFLSLSETPGLGMNAQTDSFMSQFENKNVEYFVYSKTGASADNEIDAISSATITTNAVVHGVNGAIQAVSYITGGDLDE